ncbi:CotY/CotZ family spore coat protein [Ornithinibacillus halophilus]|uniref:Spore coat protein Z n=1 Tax=Ornithinibacillus halophilus TaxID=930117 RepID=A0A1M5IRH7_9BACI|nr:CotY/CotZ family spore coat protein [Ornithinibacillus halophilus]SHG30570.1 spore coat protein Z [Ornithinibacillus halophilus]
MGCGCGRESATGNCVCDVLREILDAQEDVIENCCETSCERSINDLLGETDPGTGLDTVPVILYCKDSCKPFKGFGANRYNDELGKIGEMQASFIFRVKDIDDDCCAVLELLRNPNDPCKCDHLHDPCDQETKGLDNTGICITVDLNCFCHVTCLPAISVFN